MMLLRSLQFYAILLCSAGSVMGHTVAASTALEHPLVVCQVPVAPTAEPDRPAARVMLRDPLGEGARLVLVSPDGSVRPLTDGLHSACDPEVSFDGRCLLFAGKRTAQAAWNVYELTLENRSIRQITDSLGDCRQPCYQSSFYQISADLPWNQITFVRVDPAARNEDGSAGVSRLYACKLDGTLVRRLTYNLSSDFDPTIMWDGRMLYASWQRCTLDHGTAGRVSLLDANAEGTDVAPFVVNAGKRIKHMPCTTPRGLAVFVQADRIPWDGAGQLGAVELRRPLHTYRSLTEPADGLFHSPSPLPDGTLLVSRRAVQGGDSHAVVRLDPASKQMTAVFDDPQFHDIQAKAVVPRDEPDGRSSPVLDDDPMGRLYCLNVYNSDLPEPQRMELAAARHVRVLEGMPPEPAGEESASPPDSAPAAMRRLLGEVPLAADGSFQLELPPDTPIQLQLLDEHGFALRSCAWTWTRPHFNQGCIGCHEDPELTPENLVVDAIAQLPVRLLVPAEQRARVGFAQNIAPLVAAKCRRCHEGQGSLPLLDADDAIEIYRRLLAEERAGDAGEPVGKYVHPGRARTSPLMWHVFGRNTSRSWDGDWFQRPAKPITADGGVELTADERQLLIRWIDMGAAF